MIFSFGNAARMAFLSMSAQSIQIKEGFNPALYSSHEVVNKVGTTPEYVLKAKQLELVDRFWYLIP